MTRSRFFDAYEPVHALVAESNAELLGLVHYIFHRSTTMIGPTYYLQDLLPRNPREAGVLVAD